jgi:hypothetical protein
MEILICHNDANGMLEQFTQMVRLLFQDAESAVVVNGEL